MRKQPKFAIVRRRTWNWGQGGSQETVFLPRIGPVLYGGIWRLPWYDVMGMKLQDELPPNALTLLAKAISEADIAAALLLIHEAADAFEIYRSLGDYAALNEVIAIARVEPGDAVPERLDWGRYWGLLRGFDILGWESKSVLAALSEWAPDLAEAPGINPYGLLADQSSANELRERMLEGRGVMEQIKEEIESASSLDIVAVWSCGVTW